MFPGVSFIWNGMPAGVMPPKYCWSVTKSCSQRDPIGQRRAAGAEARTVRDDEVGSCDGLHARLDCIDRVLDGGVAADHCKARHGESSNLLRVFHDRMSGGRRLKAGRGSRFKVQGTRVKVHEFGSS